MPMVEMILECPIRESFRTSQVRGMFDLPLEGRSRQSLRVELPNEDEAWRIGAIVGPSGSGKTMLARQAFGDALWRGAEWPREACVLEAFDDSLSIREITATLTSVGFSTPQSWLRPFHVLSSGEQFRCDLARAILSGQEFLAIDEFSSVVDRTVAMVGSCAIQKAIRRRSTPARFVAITCHDDILHWLQPDWTLDMGTRELRRGRLRRAPIELRVGRCRRAAWRWFCHHHYLSAELPPGVACWLVTWDARPVAFAATTAQFGHRSAGPKLHKICRLVVLPDFQGIGIGRALMRFLGRQFTARDLKLAITTSHPAVVCLCRASSDWSCLAVRRPRTDRTSDRGRPELRSRRAQRRLVASFLYVGQPDTSVLE